jgi:ABC-2 type transport system permease protein
MVLILILLSAMLTAVAIVKEKETGTMELVLVSPAHPMVMIISKAIPYLLVGILDVIIILLLAYTVLGLPYHGHLALLMVSSSVFIALALSLGLLISTIAPDQQLAMFISLVGLLLPALIFSGFMFPLENMPAPLQVISHIIPTRWYFAILKSVMIKGLGISYVWKELLILIGMTLFLLTMAVKKFNIRLA